MRSTQIGHQTIAHRVVGFSAMAVCLLSIPPAFAQQRPGGAGNSGGGRSDTAPGNVPSNNIPNGNNGSVGNGNGPFGNNPNQTTMPYPNGRQTQAPIFLSGTVLFDDGTPANHEIRLERVCNGEPHLEGHTDSRGRFSLQLGQNMTVDTDASDASAGGSFGGYPNNTSTGSPGTFGGFGNNSRDLWNCELRASYPGYRSDTVELANRRPMDSPDVGTIVLHRLGNVQGTTISVTTALAPKNAQKDYRKGLQLAQKGKVEEAEARLQEATELYPKYADAWYALGQIQQKEGRSGEARKSYEAAIAADSKFVSPYYQMALLAAQRGNWEDAAKFSHEVITLDPVEYPASLWCNAVANYNLKHPAEAEKSTRDLLKMDTRHKFPDAENMMAQLLLAKGDYSEAAGYLRNYLTLVPDAKNADNVKRVLSKIDQAKATAIDQPNAPAPPK